MRKTSNAALVHYREAFSYLNENYATFAMIVAKIGRPVEDTHQPTAFVALDDQGRFDFHMNPDFFDTLTFEEKGFVLAHEASHVLYDHLTARKDPYYDNDQAYMLATECHVNDALIDMGMTGPENKVTGESVLNMSTAGMRLRDIYDLIVEQIPEHDDDFLETLLDMLADTCSEHAHLDENDMDEDSQQDLDNARNQVIIDIICDDNIDYEDAGDQDEAPAGLPEDIADAVNADHHEKVSSLQPGQNFSDVETSKADLAENHGVEIDFIDFLEKINPELVNIHDGKNGIIPQPSFRKPNSRYASLTNASMPIWDNDDYSDFSDEEDGKGKEVILFALDFSISVDRRIAKVMEQLMSVIPLDKADVYACTFSEESIEYIPGKERQATASGCTDFAAVTGFVDRLMEDNPNMKHPTVVMMTDSGGGFHTCRVQVAYQEEAASRYGKYGTMVKTTTPSQDHINKYYRWVLFDHHGFDNAKQNINKYSDQNINIEKDTMYNLSDLVKY